MYGFSAIVFDGKKTAGKAFDTLEDYPPGHVWIDDVAVLTKSKHGSIRVHSTWAQDDSAVSGGTAFGAITGGLLGLLLGPAGALAGATAGGSLGFMMSAATDIAVADPRLEDFAAALVDDTSALILVGEEATAADFVSAVEPLGGEIIQTDINEDDIKALRKALKA